MQDTTNERNVKYIFVSVEDGGVLKVVPEQAQVEGLDVLLTFCLTTDGWRFPATGAVTVAQPGTSFPFTAWTVKDQLAVLPDRNNESGTFSYTVAVEQDGGLRLTVDPTIVNEG